MSSRLGGHLKKYLSAAGIRLSFLNALFASFLISSSGLTQNPSGIDSNGAVTHWLVLGPYRSVNCSLPEGCDSALNSCDLLTDGRGIVGDQWEPRAGDEVESDCGRSAACLDWICTAAARA